MEKWKKGYLFVNGYNLGRYWNKGPQYKIFLPGVWLKKGIN
jgi:beta-galactosidase